MCFSPEDIGAEKIGVLRPNFAVDPIRCNDQVSAGIHSVEFPVKGQFALPIDGSDSEGFGANEFGGFQRNGVRRSG
jgi:hypothetical protein